MEQGLSLEIKAQKPFLPESASMINGAFVSIKVMQQAPVIVLVNNELGVSVNFKRKLSVDERVAELCNVQSVAAAIENMLLTAQSMGIGSLWLGDIFFSYPELAAWLAKKDPGHGMLVAGICLGYPDELPKARSRKSFLEATTFLQ